MTEADPDERFKIEGDREDALRDVLSTAPGTLAALDAQTRGALRDVQQADEAYRIAVETAKHAQKVPADQPEVLLALDNLERSREEWRNLASERAAAAERASASKQQT